MSPYDANAPRRSNAKVMDRFDITGLLVAKLRHEEAVIGGIGNTNFDLWSVGHRPQNFYMLASMGMAVPIALGVALAQPRRHVFALEGDGSLLMQVGCLATVAMLAPPNLTVIVMDNGAYDSTGAQPTATSAGADLVMMSRGAGIAESHWAADEADFEKLIDQGLQLGGPSLIGAHIKIGPSRSSTDRDPPQIRDRFMRGIGTKDNPLRT